MSQQVDFVLLIDDDEPTNFFHKLMVEESAVTKKILVAQTGNEGVRLLKEVFTKPDVKRGLVFIDINMPMIDGFQFIETLKIKFSKRFKSIKIVILTSSLSIHDREKSMSISKDILFLNKPLTKEALNQI
jgi:CheY-like chemotaxis protein